MKIIKLFSGEINSNGNGYVASINTNIDIKTNQKLNVDENAKNILLTFENGKIISKEDIE